MIIDGVLFVNNTLTECGLTEYELNSWKESLRIAYTKQEDLIQENERLSNELSMAYDHITELQEKVDALSCLR